MSQEPKKVGRRTFLNYAIAVIVTGVIVGAATYFAKPKGEVTVTVPGTTVTTTKTITTTVTGTPTTSPTTSPTTTPTTTTTERRITLRWWDLEGVGPASENLRKQYMAEHPNVEIIFEGMAYSALYEKILAASGTEMAPDIISVNDRWLFEVIEQGLVRPLPKEEIDLNKYFENFVIIYKDKIWGLPARSNACVFYYRTDLIDEPPKTWDEVLTLAQELNGKEVKGKKIYGFAYPGSAHDHTSSRFLGYLASRGEDAVVTQEGRNEVRIDNPKVIEYIKFYTDLYTKYKVMPPAIPESDGSAIANMFAQGTIAMMIQFPYPGYGFKKSYPELEWSYALLPETGYSQPATWNLMIPTGSKHPDEAWEFIKYLQRPEIDAQFNFDCSAQKAGQFVGHWGENPDFWKIPYESMKRVRPLPHIWPCGLYNKYLYTMIGEILLGTKSVEQAAKEYAEKVRKDIYPFRGKA